MALTVWTPENKEKAINDILEHVASGKSVKSLIDHSGRDVIPSYTTWCEWLKESTDLADNYARAMESRQEVIFEEILVIADDQEGDVYKNDEGIEFTNHNVIQRSKVRIEARQWVLGRMNAKKYGNKIDMTSGGDKLPSSQAALNITLPDGTKLDDFKID